MTPPNADGPLPTPNRFLMEVSNLKFTPGPLTKLVNGESNPFEMSFASQAPTNTTSVSAASHTSAPTPTLPSLPLPNVIPRIADHLAPDSRYAPVVRKPQASGQQDHMSIPTDDSKRSSQPSQLLTNFAPLSTYQSQIYQPVKRSISPSAPGVPSATSGLPSFVPAAKRPAFKDDSSTPTTSTSSSSTQSHHRSKERPQRAAAVKARKSVVNQVESSDEEYEEPVQRGRSDNRDNNNNSLSANTPAVGSSRSRTSSMGSGTSSISTSNKRKRYDEVDDFGSGERGTSMSANDEEDGRLLTEEEKRRRFLERNRIAAHKCRQKKKQWMQELEARSMEAEKQNKEMHILVSQLREEIVMLKNQMLLHRDCNCESIRSFVNSPRFAGIGANGYNR
ncbi:hypothetical protein HDV05_004431 [Chytridiales sp. JEL 0842]|nr:hypothetical protein HDV05_004431 [Chytridiales sp. JEL 0842]